MMNYIHTGFSSYQTSRNCEYRKNTFFPVSQSLGSYMWMVMNGRAGQLTQKPDYSLALLINHLSLYSRICRNNHYESTLTCVSSTSVTRLH